ncbi:MAG: aminodeoxychorismate/anthranilate synthase component II [Gammaproteobacteria bacterium]|nr:aminodeoxychorismate/anthranilate synthase component II [Gammaproteobacteria bacterium]
MILLIDNYDSFTYNLYQQIESLGYKTVVVQNDAISIDEVKNLKPKKIIISPGPGTPDASGICKSVIRAFYTSIPILGVCLGHQCIGVEFNSKIQTARQIIHGKTAAIFHHNQSIFYNLSNPFEAALYHSLAINKVPDNFQKLAWTSDDEIMAIQHNEYPLIGIQFHPESFMTELGNKLVANFLEHY